MLKRQPRGVTGILGTRSPCLAAVRQSRRQDGRAQLLPLPRQRCTVPGGPHAAAPALSSPTFGPTGPGQHRTQQPPFPPAGPPLSTGAASAALRPRPPPPALPGQRGRGQGVGQAFVTERKQTMPLPETMFCAQQIKIPPELPDILKQFTKAAIRTQPRDVLRWSAAYFSALSKGEPLPVKERIEMPLPTEKTDAGLTPGLLKILHKQLSPKGMVSVAELKEKWQHLCLPEEQLKAILQLDDFGEEVEWMKVLALGCSVLGGSLLSSMKHACEILTSDPEGGAARIPFETFAFLYSYLASIDGEIPEEKTEAFLHGIKEQADKQTGMVLLRNFLTQPSTLF